MAGPISFKSAFETPKAEEELSFSSAFPGSFPLDGQNTGEGLPFSSAFEAGPPSLVGLSQSGALSVAPELTGQDFTTRDIEGVEDSGPQEPLVDPVSAFAGGFGASAFLARKAGATALQAIGRGVVSGTVGALSDFPIGQAAEEVGGIDERLALPFAVLVGLVSGATLERVIERKIIKTFSKSKVPQEIIQSVTKQVTEAIAESNPEKADSILELAARTQPTAEVRTKADKSILELAQESQLPKKKGFERTAEDLVVEQAEKRGSKVKVAPEDPIPADKVVNEPSAEPQTPPITKTDDVDGEAKIQTPDGEQIIGGRLSAEASEAAIELARKMGASIEEADEINKMVDSINLDRIDTEDDVKRLMQEISLGDTSAIDQARRGKISHDETKRAAMRSGVTEKTLLKHKTGQALNAEDSLKASMINAASAKRVFASMKKVNEGGTDQDLLEFLALIEKHKIIQAAESGIATEAGRALSARRIVKTGEEIELKSLKAIIDKLGGREVTEDIAKRLAQIDPSDIGSVNKFLQEAGKATTADKVFEVWVNSLLSSPITHMVNVTSNGLTFLSQFPEHAVAGGFDAVRSAITGKPRSRFAGEAAEAFFSIGQGLKLGVRNMLWSFRTGLPSDAQAKLETRTFRAIEGKIGEVIRLPGRALIAMDEFYKGVNYTTELHALAFREATKQGLKGKAKASRIATIVNNPSKELTEKARETMLNRVFQKELSGSLKKLSAARLQEDRTGIILRFIVPFVRTPVNIAKFGLERTPLGFIDVVSRQLGKDPLAPEDLANQLSKATLGTMIGAVTYQYALEGKVTGGGPKNRLQREALYRTNWRPYSIKIGNKYYPYGRLEPIGSILGMAADLAEGTNALSEEEYSDLAVRMVRSVSKNVTSKTFLRGLSNALDALSDPDRYAGPWMESFGGTVVPRIVAGAARSSDDFLRETEGLGEYIQSQIPFLSQDLLPKRNLWGEPIEREGGFTERFLSPVQVSTEKGSLADREIVKLGMSIGKPQPIINGIELTPKEYDEFLTQAGARAKKLVGNLVTQKSYAKLPEERQMQQIRSRYDTAVKIERARFFPKIRQKRIEASKFDDKGVK